MNPPRCILHVDLDAFFVSVERVLNPKLCGLPVVVGGSPQSRGVVAAASYEARAFGVRSAMPMGQAHRLCPDLVRISGTPGMYGRASKAVFSLLKSYTPVIEKVSIDEAYLDFTGMGFCFDSAVDQAEKMRIEVKNRLRLDITVGISQNRLVSKVASAFAKPQGLFDVQVGREARFLAPLPLRALPGIGPVTAKSLEDLGFSYLGQVAQADAAVLLRAFGSQGAILKKRAEGLDATPVRSSGQPRQSSSLGHDETFLKDTRDLSYLEKRLQNLLARASYRLRKKNLLAKTVTVKVRKADFTSKTQAFTLPRPTDYDVELIEQALRILRSLTVDRPLVRLVGVRLSGLTSGVRQGDLFDAEATRGRKLYSVADQVRKKYGFRSVGEGSRLRSSPSFEE